MKLSEAKDLKEVAQAVEEKCEKQGFYALTYKIFHHYMVFDVACPTDAFLQKQKEAKSVIVVSEKLLALKDMFFRDHIKIDLCKFLEPRKSKKHEYYKEWKRAMDDATSEPLR